MCRPHSLQANDQMKHAAFGGRQRRVPAVMALIVTMACGAAGLTSATADTGSSGTNSIAVSDSRGISGSNSRGISGSNSRGISGSNVRSGAFGTVELVGTVNAVDGLLGLIEVDDLTVYVGGAAIDGVVTLGSIVYVSGTHAEGDDFVLADLISALSLADSGGEEALNDSYE